MCDEHVFQSHRVQPAKNNLVVDHVVADDRWSLIDGHPLVKFAGHKRACYVLSRNKRRQVAATSSRPLGVRHAECTYARLEFALVNSRTDVAAGSSNCRVG